MGNPIKPTCQALIESSPRPSTYRLWLFPESAVLPCVVNEPVHCSRPELLVELADTVAFNHGFVCTEVKLDLNEADDWVKENE